MTTASRPRDCAECGKPFQPVASYQCYCPGPLCKRAFNNRRMTRGAELYDLWMTLRYDRPLAQAYGVWKLLCRLAWQYRDEDNARRNGRKSWRSPRAILDRNPSLRATVVHRKAA